MSASQQQRADIKAKYYHKDPWNPENLDNAWLDNTTKLNMERATKTLIRNKREDPSNPDLLALDVLRNYQNAYYNQRGSE